MEEKMKIAITRPEQRSKAAIKIIEDHGGEALVRPTLELKLKNSDSLKELIKQADTLDWLIITSVTSIESLCEFYPNFQELLNPNCKVATIGHKTAELAIKKGLDIDLVPEDYTAEGLLQEFENIDVNNKIIGIPRTFSARTLLPDELEKRGAKVILAESYKSEIPEDTKLIRQLIDEILSEEIDGIIFTSPLTVKNLFEMAHKGEEEEIANKLSTTTLTVSIGPITAKILDEYNVKYIYPETYTVKDMLDLMFKELENLN